MNRWRQTGTIAVSISIALLVVACGSDDHAGSRAKAERFVAATVEAGLAPRLTVEVAESLYGNDAATVCEAFDGPLSSAEEIILLGNPSGRRHKTITTHALEYAQLVVETYCPEHLPNIVAVVDDLEPFETSG